MAYDAPMEYSGKGLAERGAPARARSTAAYLTVACTAAVGVLLLLPATPAARAGGDGTGSRPPDRAVVGAPIADEPADIAQFWTQQRMLDARPAETPTPPEAAFDIQPPGSTWTSTARAAAGESYFFPTGIESFPLRVHGKIFFLVGDQAFVCSGTVVDSRGGNVVFTAGHCVFDRENGQYVDRLAFVPAYRDGDAPLGIWPATAVFTPSRYAEQGQLSHDLGAVILAERIQQTLGARKIAFNLDPSGRSFRILGYPAQPAPPFDGERMAGCDSEVIGRDPGHGRPSTLAVAPCLMGEGASGGGWITGGEYLNSVMSYTYCREDTQDLCGTVFGPYFGSQAVDLYTFPAVGGSVTPTIRLRSAPPRRINRRWAKFRFGGSGSTPLSFRCRLDGRSPFRCGKKTTLKRLRESRHVLRIYSIDQTDRRSKRTVKRSFRVVPRGR